MRKELIIAETREQAESLAPWADFFAEVEGGWMAFESQSDYDTWMRQQ